MNQYLPYSFSVKNVFPLSPQFFYPGHLCLLLSPDLSGPHRHPSAVSEAEGTLSFMPFSLNLHPRLSPAT